MIKKTGRFLNVYLSDVAPISSLAFTNQCTLPYSTAEEIKKKINAGTNPYRFFCDLPFFLSVF
jgi:hypothetical protein